MLALACAPAAPSDAIAARTSYDPNGTFLVDGAKFFPISLSLGPPLDGTTPAGANALDEVTSAGVNVLRAGPLGVPFSDSVLAETEAMNRAAAARGVYTWVNLRELARAQPGTPEEATLRRVVTRLADDPALALWKGADEPLWVGYPPASLTYAYCLTTARGDDSWCTKSLSLDPFHLWVTIQAPRGTAEQLAPYSAVTDSHGVDVYPVGIAVANPNLHDVGTWTKMIESVTPNRVVWTTLQVCFSGSYDAAGNFVLPTITQERYMVYDAIINGARALNFFGGQNERCLNSTDAASGWNWTFWNDVLKPLVLEIGPRGPLYAALLEPASALPLTTNDPTTEVTSRRVGNEIWVIAARHGVGTAHVQIGGLPLDSVTGSVYTEGRSIAVEGGTLTDSFPQWAVHVYRFEDTGMPGTWITSGPTGTVSSRSAAFAFGGARVRRFECSLDRGAFRTCTSPAAVSRLTDGAHRFRVRAVDESGRPDPTPATRTWTVDTTPPAVRVAALPAVQRSLGFPVRWSATDQASGVASYDVRYREATWRGPFTRPLPWQAATTATRAAFGARAGSTYCFSARAVDTLGNSSAWTTERCTVLPLDDRALVAAGRWARRSSNGSFLATHSAASTRGATLVRRGVRARRLSLVVGMCPGCGAVRVFWNGELVRTIPLRATTTRRSVIVDVASFRRIRTGTLAVRVRSARKRVEIDGLVASPT
ncbi:MAG TPA: hypothetical protein VHF67_13675 [Gaiellaceae bacterium]|nr:hypothetical protein [Gaiellaceae bacterium]